MNDHPAISEPALGATDLQCSLDVISFGRDQCLRREVNDLEALFELLERQPDLVHWVNMDSVANVAVINALGARLNIHPLALEDVVHIRQRAKTEEYQGYLFIVTKMASLVEEELVTEQLSIFLFENLVVSIQEGRPGDCLGAIRDRLNVAGSNLRQRAADYLTYALIDAAVDSFFGPLQIFGEQLDRIELLMESPEPVDVVADLHYIRRNLLTLRRSIWQLRDAIGGMLRLGPQLVHPETQVHLRDSLDHTIQILELAETYREVGSDLRELHFAQVGQQTNEVMRVLTIIATIFMPLSFIAGVYGMNFNTQRSWANMPELDWPFGYPLVLGVMLTVFLSMLGMFWHWGWLGRNRPRL